MWILLTLAAALLQTFRNLVSKRLSGTLTTGIASLCRFLFGAPIVGFLCLFAYVSGPPVTVRWPMFLLTCAGMAFFQVLANVLLIELFKLKNFAVSMTLIKVETILIAVLGVYSLNEVPGAYGWAGIVIASVGLAIAGGVCGSDRGPGRRFSVARSIFSVPSLFALGAGAALALCTVFLKKTYAYISSANSLSAVVVTLFFIMLIQTAFSLCLIPRRDLARLREVFAKPLLPVLTGFFAVTASICWFSAFKLQMAAYVRTLGQAEFIFGLVVSVAYFKERVTAFEVFGMGCVVIGSALLFL